MVDVQSFADEFRWTSDSILRAWSMIAKAKRPWHDTANAGWFRRAGTPPLSVLGYFDPGDEQACQDLNGRGLIQMLPANATWECHGLTRGFVRPVCQDWGVATWWMGICPSDSFIFDYAEWSSHGYPGPGEIDIIATITHELGHLLGLDHPSGNEFCDDQAVMCAGTHSDGTIRQRQLYEYDVHCIQELEDELDPAVATRNVESRVYIQQPNGSFLSEEQNPTSWIKGSTIALPDGGRFRAMLRVLPTSPNSQYRAYSGFSSASSGTGFNSSGLGVVPTLSYWPFHGYDSDLRLYRHQSAGSGWNSVMRVAQARFDIDTFPINQVFDGNMGVCTGFSSCERRPVASGYRLSHAFDPVQFDIYTAWQNQNRQDDNEDHEIWISAGVHDTTTFLTRERTGIKTLYNPSLACTWGAAVVGGVRFDCILAYVEFDSELPRLQLRYFYRTSWGTTTWSSTTTSLYTSGGAPAIWYNQTEEKWYLARVTVDASTVVILNSVDGVNWNAVEDLGYSITSPVAGSVFSHVEDYSLVITRPY